MDYDTAVAVFLQPAPEGVPTPRPVAEARPARRLRDACEPLATHAFWNPLTNAANRERGLDFLTGYVWGRASALGEPLPAVVASAFAWFVPGLVTAAYDEGRSRVPWAEMVRSRDATTAESLRRILAGAEVADVADVADVAAVVAALRRGLEAADGTGRPLFSGLRSRDWPDEPVGQLWRACDLLREHRGDSHVAVCTAAGFGPIEMNVLTELWVGMEQLSYTATRGWDQGAMAAALARLEAGGLVAGGALTDAGRSARDALEERTDALERPIVDAIGDELGSVLERLDEWSQACIDAGAFPPDPRKRAAG